MDQEKQFVNRLYILRVGRLEIPDIAELLPKNGASGPVSIPVYCYLLEHEKGRVLVDTGVASAERGAVKEEEQLGAQLQKLGLTPENIDYVILTHMHLDHAENIRLFPHAVFVVRKKELEMARHPAPREGGYVLSQYAGTQDYTFIQLEEEETADLFGDGSIMLMDTRGHSAGHQSVLVRLREDGDFVLAGDAAYFERNLTDGILPGRCTDESAARESLKKLAALKENGSVLLYGHDHEQEGTLRICPDFYS